MTWRTVVISRRAKLDYSMGALVFRGDETRKIHLTEIATIIIESTAVSLTSALLCELMHQGIKVVFCDEKYNPQSELVPYVGCHDSSEKIKQQCNWSDDVKQNVWTAIIKNKIEQQTRLLKTNNHEESVLKLEEYINDLQPGDVTNREGLAAKVYFNALFEKASFSRNDKSLSINSALNYGYSLLLSAINREIAANGYLMQMGLHHSNSDNPFNLGCDLMEPWRPLVDELVQRLQPEKFETEEGKGLGPQEAGRGAF